MTGGRAETSGSSRKPSWRRCRDSCSRRKGAAGCWEVTVALVDDARLQALHRDFMGIDEPTDIMTFPATTEGDGARAAIW